MRAGNTLILWNAGDHKPPIGDAPPGSSAVGALETEDGCWSHMHGYSGSGGAAYVARRNLPKSDQERQVMLDWYQLVYTYALDPYVVHRAFLLIDEYQDIIKRMGCGPAKDEPGHDPEVSHGRAVQLPVPNLKIVRTGPATHFWPIVGANRSKT